MPKTWLPLLRGLVSRRATILITGGTGTGKTTLMKALLAECGASERIVTVEEVRELACWDWRTMCRWFRARPTWRGGRRGGIAGTGEGHAAYAPGPCGAGRMPRRGDRRSVACAELRASRRYDDPARRWCGPCAGADGSLGTIGGIGSPGRGDVDGPVPSTWCCTWNGAMADGISARSVAWCMTAAACPACRSPRGMAVAPRMRRNGSRSGSDGWRRGHDGLGRVRGCCGGRRGVHRMAPSAVCRLRRRTCGGWRQRRCWCADGRGHGGVPRPGPWPPARRWDGAGGIGESWKVSVRHTVHYRGQDGCGAAACSES